jgi:hypothetical protein
MSMGDLVRRVADKVPREHTVRLEEPTQKTVLLMVVAVRTRPRAPNTRGAARCAASGDARAARQRVCGHTAAAVCGARCSTSASSTGVDDFARCAAPAGLRDALRRGRLARASQVQRQGDAPRRGGVRLRQHLMTRLCTEQSCSGAAAPSGPWRHAAEDSAMHVDAAAAWLSTRVARVPSARALTRRAQQPSKRQRIPSARRPITAVLHTHAQARGTSTRDGGAALSAQRASVRTAAPRWACAAMLFVAAAAVEAAELSASEVLTAFLVANGAPRARAAAPRAPAAPDRSSHLPRQATSSSRRCCWRPSSSWCCSARTSPTRSR